MNRLAQLSLALSVALLYTGCAEIPPNQRWTDTETSSTSRNSRPPGNPKGPRGLLVTTTTCQITYVGRTEESRRCEVADKFLPPPKKEQTSQTLSEMGKGIVVFMMESLFDDFLDTLDAPKAPPAGDMPSNMTVLPPADAVDVAGRPTASVDVKPAAP